MKKYFAVSFKYSGSVYCSNIAHAETAEAVNAHYSEYEWVSVRECEDCEVETACRKGMPIVEIETPEAVTEESEQKEEETEIKEIIINQIIKFFENNKEIFNSCVEELDCYNGFLCDDRYYCMEELDEFYRDANPMDLLYRAFYGHDDDTWTADASGDKIFGEFNPNRMYFYYNGYGNLISSDYKDYSGRLDRYAVEEMSENRCYVDSIEDDEELSALFDALEEDEETEE